MTENAHRTHPPHRSILVRWDAAGNLGQVSTRDEHSGDVRSRFLFWTEDSRLHTVADDRHHSYYAYDHAGERTLKLTGYNNLLDVNADCMATHAMLKNPTLYPSPYIVLSNHGYTKHYYAGAERIAARIGGGGLEAPGDGPTDDNDRADLLFGQSLDHANSRHLEENDPDCIPDNAEGISRYIEEIPQRLQADVYIELEEFQAVMRYYSDNSDPEPEVYFYHSDHLGSASWITDANGTPVQHLQYLPYGEPYINQRNNYNDYNERFTFTGKERDEETGYGYFGARYMDHELMTMWLSVDPLSDKYPSISPYAHCAWNPIRLIDPDGMDVYEYRFDLRTGEWSKTGDKGGALHHTVTYINSDGSSSITEGDGSVSYAWFGAGKGSVTFTQYDSPQLQLTRPDQLGGSLMAESFAESDAFRIPAGMGNIVTASASAAGHNASNVAEYIADEVNALRQGNPKMANRIPSTSKVLNLTIDYKVGRALKLAGRYGGGGLAGFNVGLQWYQFGQNKTVGNFTRATISTMALGVGLCSGPVAAACVLGWGIFDLAVGDRVFNGW